MENEWKKKTISVGFDQHAVPALEISGSTLGFNRLKDHFLRAWRLMLSSGALVATIVLLINLLTLIVVYTNYEVKGHTATLFTGDCSTAGSTVSWLHLVINLLSSILLAASNFSMQCLSSPSRTEVNKAHAKRRWLAIGTPNVRNLRHVSRKKAMLWIMLGLSSFPLHLIWNSVVFQTLAPYDYLAISAREDFLHGGDLQLGFCHSGGPAPALSATGRLRPAINDLQKAAQQSTLTYLETGDCIREYAQQFHYVESYSSPPAWFMG